MLLVKIRTSHRQLWVSIQPGGKDRTSNKQNLAEFTFVRGKEDNYDISLVDGFNILLNIIPSISTCAEPQCQVNINALCPPLLRTSFDQKGVNLGCIAPCNAGFGQEIYGNRACCTGKSTILCICNSQLR